MEDPTKDLVLVPIDEECDAADPEVVEIRKCFQDALNRHGYGFQYAVIKKAAELHGKGSRWVPTVAELPVPLGVSTRIDFILRDQAFSARTTLVCECKRVNEAFGRWCFIPTPFTHNAQAPKSERLIMDSVEFSAEGNRPRRVRVRMQKGIFLEPAYGVGLVVKGEAKGDSKPRKAANEDAIEDAATQVLRGSNGYIETLAQHRKLLREREPHIVLPVIFTTATLWVSSADLSSADPLSGEIDITKAEFRSVPWLWYQYHMSPSLKHSVRREQEATDLGEMLDSEYIRTVVIVGRGGTENFLMTSSQRDLLSPLPVR
jgi:hypothetical protein